MHRKKRIRTRAITSLILLSIIVLCVVWMAYWSYPDPRKSLKALAGLTPDQVIARLGPPRFGDPRDPGFFYKEGWTPDQEAERGPLTFYYVDSFPRWRAYHYAIVFEHNRVVNVVRVIK